MSEYTTLTIERTTNEVIERIATATRLKKIDIVALAVELYEKNLPTSPTSPSQPQTAE
jgi:hypothetical protein